MRSPSLRRLLLQFMASRLIAVLLVELHPPSLHGAGLEAALSDVLARANSNGAATDLHISPDLTLSVEQESLVFRTAQEAVRNVATHASASHVAVNLAGENGSYELRVTDDCIGFEPRARLSARAQGHLGLNLLADRARDLGARLTIDSKPGRGTTILLRGPTS
jgi:two-component system, NarL family, sensor kinase